MQVVLCSTAHCFRILPEGIRTLSYYSRSVRFDSAPASLSSSSCCRRCLRSCSAASASVGAYQQFTAETMNPIRAKAYAFDKGSTPSWLTGSRTETLRQPSQCSKELNVKDMLDGHEQCKPRRHADLRMLETWVRPYFDAN